VALAGLFLQGLACVRSIAPAACPFTEITGPHARPDSRSPKCSLVAFLGRERQRAVNG
jgi:hypothetical protein